MLRRTMTLPFLAAVLLAAAGPASAQLPNLTYKIQSNWDYPLVPTTQFPAVSPFVVPATLPGNSSQVYMNSLAYNNGTATADNVGGIFNIDGDLSYFYIVFAPVNPGVAYTSFDLGPVTVRGGRHTFEAIHDNENVVVESNETDNWWAHQFVFTPYVLSESTPKWRGPPPERLGGTSSIVDGSLFTINCDGFRFTSTGWWNAITMYATDLVTDHDLALYPPSTGSENGFLTTTAASGFTEGQLDALIVNRNTVGVADYDVGVNRWNGTGNFVIEQVVSESAWVGMTTTASYGADEDLKIWDTYIGDTGWITVSVTDSLNTSIGFKLGLLEYDTTEIGLQEVPSWETSDENREIRLNRNITTTGYYGLVIYRDPDQGNWPLDLTVSIEPTPPDLTSYMPNLWHSDLVPTLTPILPGMDPLLPDTLYGYMPETYINFGLHNDSPTPSPPSTAGVYLDGRDNDYIAYDFPGLIADDHWDINDGVAYDIPGGRHTLILETDILEGVHEIYEKNNRYGEQYCWSPLELSPGGQYSHASPGHLLGGSEILPPGDPHYYNCDGYRIRTGIQRWEGMVLTQGPNSDYDLDIHHPLAGVKDGFNDYLAGSWFYSGETDYVLVNNHVLAPDVYDIGVTNWRGTEPYTVEVVGSTTLPPPTDGRYGPYNMPVSRMLHIYDIYLEQDVYAFRVDNLGPAVDWGMDLHSYDIGLTSREYTMPGGVSYLNGPGQGEFFTLNITTAGWYGLAVYKATPYDFDLDGEYQLTILQGLSDVDDPEDVPAVTALQGARPNPFNPRTTISFDLATAGAVALEIYDLKGARVRCLVDESMVAGQHAVVWNGENDLGQRVASGVYLARFHSGKHSEVGKLVMLK